MVTVVCDRCKETIVTLDSTSKISDYVSYVEVHKKLLDTLYSAETRRYCLCDKCMKDFLYWRCSSQPTFTSEEVCDKLVEVGQHDHARFKLNETIMYNPSEVKHILDGTYVYKGEQKERQE